MYIIDDLAFGIEHSIESTASHASTHMTSESLQRHTIILIYRNRNQISIKIYNNNNNNKYKVSFSGFCYDTTTYLQTKLPY